MAMVRWDPFSEMMTVQRDMNRLFQSLGMPLYASKGDGERVQWMPTVDVMKKGDDLLIRAEVPGVKPEDVDVTVSDDVLTIRGQRTEEEEHKEGEYIRKESTFGVFERQVMLPQGTSTSNIRAEYHDGVLEITVPQAAKTEKPETQHVPIAQATQSPMGAGQQGGYGQDMQGQQAQQINVERGGQGGGQGY